MGKRPCSGDFLGRTWVGEQAFDSTEPERVLGSERSTSKSQGRYQHETRLDAQEGANR